MSHTKALELLEKEACPERAEFLVEFGEWCLSAGLPRRDAEIALDSALDVLFEIDQPFFSAAVNATADALEIEDVAKSQLATRDQIGAHPQDTGGGNDGGGGGGQGGGSDGSRFSPLGSARSQRSGTSGPASSRGGAMATSRAGAASARSGSGGGGGGGASRGSGGGSTRGGGKSARGGSGSSSSSGNGGSGSSGDLLSLALGGARGGLDCTQLECAVRALTMRAAMAPTAGQRRSFLTAASHYAERVVHGAVRAANLHRASLAFQKRLPKASPPVLTPEAPPDPKAKKGGKGAPAAAAAAAPTPPPPADDSLPIEAGHTPTNTPFDDAAHAACAMKLNLPDPKALTLEDFCGLVLDVLEQPPGLPSSDSPPNEGDGKSAAGGAGTSMVVGPPLDAEGLAAQEVARATAARMTAANLPGAPYFTYPATPSEWSAWTSPPPLVTALAALPDTLQVLAPSPATLPKLPITLHHMHALMQSLSEEGLHVQALPVAALGELASRTAALPPLPPLQTLWAVRAAKLRLQLGDNASAALCLANAPSLGLAEPEANLYLDEVALVEQQRAKSTVANKAPNSTSENIASKANAASSKQSLLLSDSDGKGKSASKPWKVSNCPVRSAWAALAVECAATPELALFRPSREYASHTRRHAEAFGDHAAAAQCCLAEASALEMEGLPNEAAQQVLTAQLLWRRSAPTGAAGTIRDWATSTLTLARLLVTNGDAKEAERCLTDILTVLRKRLAAADLTASSQAGVVPGETVATAAWAVAAVCGHLANLHAAAGFAALSSSSGTSGGPRAEALRQWSSRAAQADALWGEAHFVLAAQGTSLEASLALAEQALGRRKLLGAEAQDRGDAPGLGVEGTTRLTSDVLPLLEQACDEVMVLHRALAPPREDLLLSNNSRGGGGTGSSAEKDAALASPSATAPTAAKTNTVELWPTPVVNAPLPDPALSLPITRACGRLCLAVASCRLELAVACGEPASQRRQALEYEARVTDTVARWIDATAPPTVKPTVALTPTHLDVALMRAQSAERLLASSGAQCPDASVLLATAGSGQALTLLAMRSGLLDDAWSDKTTENSTNPPRRALTGLFANKALAATTETEHLAAIQGEADSGGGSDGSSSTPPLPPPPRAVSLLRTMRVEERGDLAWQARQALEAGALQAVAVKDWASVGPRAASLIELAGSRDPITGVTWLLLYQACVSRAWLASLLTSAAVPTSRLGRQLRVLGAAAGSNNGSTLVEGSDKSSEDLGKPLSAKYGGVLGQPREQPLVQRTLAVLQGDRHASSSGGGEGLAAAAAAGGKAAPKGKGGGKGGSATSSAADAASDVSSAAWAMLDCARPVPSTLRALPASCCALVLQLSPNKDALYVAMVARGSLDGQSGGGKGASGGLPSECRAPVLYRYELPAGAWRSIMNLKRDFKAWRSAVARFLTRFGDDLGVSGDTYPGGASATRAWRDGQPPKGDIVSEACRKAEELEASAAEAMREADAATAAAEQAAAAAAEEQANAATAPKDEAKDSKKAAGAAKGKKGAPPSEDQLASDAAALAETAAAKATASEAAVAAAANARRHADQVSADLEASLDASWQLDSLEQQLVRLVSDMDALLGPCLGGNGLTTPTAASASSSPLSSAGAPAGGKRPASGTAAESSRGATPPQQQQQQQEAPHPLRRALDALAACDSSACAADGLAPGLVLWADHQLLDLPLEALAPLRRRHFKLWARDFSAHVFANRYAAAEPAYAAASASSGGGGEGGSGFDPDGSAAVSVERSDVCAVIDPRSEDTGPSPAAVAAAARVAGVSLQLTTDQGNEVSPSSDNPSSSNTAAAGPGARLSAMQVLRGPLTQEGGASKWRAGATVAGDDRMVSSGEWQGLLTSSKQGGFLFYGPGQALAHLPPSCLAGLDARGCRMAIVIDQMDNDASFRRKAKEDSSGGASQASVLALQQPLESAAMWSLTGIGSLVQNQWAASFHANAKLVQTLFKGLHGEGLQLGAAVAAATTAEVALPPPSPAAEGRDEGAAGGVCYAKARAMYNPVVYGLPAVHFTGGRK